MKRITLSLLLALGASAASAPILAQPAGVPRPAPHAAVYEHEALAADQPLASAAGEEILAKGGNAVDAAVATSFALSVVRPFSCGIGGGGFMVIVLPAHDGKPGVTTTIDYRETCPGAIGADYYEKLPLKDGKPDVEASRHGGRAVATPGTIPGLLYALDKYGTLNRAVVLAPAIRLAREGFTADTAYAKAATETSEKFQKNPDWKTRFAFTWLTLLGSGAIHEGDRIVNPHQAEALELIAREGAKAFSQGELGKAIVKIIAAEGGVLTPEDLKSYRPLEAEPIRFDALGRTFITMPPPSSGGVAMGETLGILERRDAAGMVKREEWTPYTHTLIEAFKHAFADRAEWMADPAFVKVPTARLLSDAYLKERAARITITQTHGPEIYGTREQVPDDGGTSHLCVVDSRGGAVSCTETINLLFGSFVAVPEFGFVLNDQMDDFTTIRGKPNAFKLVQSDKNLPAPGKRPLSSMTPTIVLDKDGHVEAIAGASGGPRIITATTQVLLNTLLLDLPADQAVARPRLHHQWLPNLLEVEDGYPGRWQGIPVPIWMTKLHHQSVAAKEFACVQLIKRASADGKVSWQAACDPRKGGAPAGR